MEDLRKAMPSIPDVLKELHANPNNNKLSMFQILIVTIIFMTRCARDK